MHISMDDFTRLHAQKALAGEILGDRMEANFLEAFPHYQMGWERIGLLERRKGRIKASREAFMSCMAATIFPEASAVADSDYTTLGLPSQNRVIADRLEDLLLGHALDGIPSVRLTAGHADMILAVEAFAAKKGISLVDAYRAAYELSGRKESPVLAGLTHPSPQYLEDEVHQFYVILNMFDPNWKERPEMLGDLVRYVRKETIVTPFGEQPTAEVLGYLAEQAIAEKQLEQREKGLRKAYPKFKWWNSGAHITPVHSLIFFAEFDRERYWPGVREAGLRALASEEYRGKFYSQNIRDTFCYRLAEIAPRDQSVLVETFLQRGFKDVVLASLTEEQAAGWQSGFASPRCLTDVHALMESVDKGTPIPSSKTEIAEHFRAGKDLYASCDYQEMVATKETVLVDFVF